MMNLDRQIQVLIDDAPDLESQISVAAIAPVLQEVAATLPLTEYYICQSSAGEWEISTLRHRQQLNLEIQAIYAFAKIEDIAKVNRGELKSASAVKISIVQLLFQMLAIPTLDRVIFFNNSQNLDRGQEIHRSQLMKLIAVGVASPLENRLKSIDTHPSLPPDVC
jgi:hypothetical protein